MENEQSLVAFSLDVRFKDVTFETLDRDNFLDLVEWAFPDLDWEKTYKEFKAAREGKSKQVIV